MNCVNCGHGSLVKSNFKRLPDGKTYCILKCSEVYESVIRNSGARQKGDKPE